MRRRRCFYCEEPEPEWDCFFTDGDGFLSSLSEEAKDKAICSDCVLALRDKIVYQYEEERIEIPYNGEFIFVNPDIPVEVVEQAEQIAKATETHRTDAWRFYREIVTPPEGWHIAFSFWHSCLEVTEFSEWFNAVLKEFRKDNLPHVMVWLSNSNLLVTYGCLLMRQREEAERLFREAQAQTMEFKGALWR